MKIIQIQTLVAGLCLNLMSLAVSQNAVAREVPLSGLIGWWSFDGNASDASGNAHHGVINGATTTTGKFDQAYYFDGSSSIDVGDLDFSSETFTVSGWIRTTNEAVAEDWRMWISKMDSPIGLATFECLIGDGRSESGENGPAFYVWNSGYGVGASLADASVNVRDGNWHMITVTCATGVQKLYVNGNLAGADDYAGALPQTSNPVLIGGIDFGPYHHPWMGDIDEVLIYNRVLDADEVLQLFNGIASGTAPSIITQPSSQTVIFGDTASFSVVAEGSSTLNYQWRKDGVDISGATASSLSLTDVQSADFGNYSVIVSNSVGDVSSQAATLALETSYYARPVSGLIGWWPLDGNVKDFSGNGHHGRNYGATVTAGITTAISAHAYHFEGTKSIDVGKLDFSGGSYTISGWIRTSYGPVANDYRSWIGKANSPAGNATFEGYLGEGSDLGAKNSPAFIVWNGGAGSVNAFNTNLNVRDGNWHLITMTYTNGSQKLYADGTLAAFSAYAGSLPLVSNPVLIGGSHFGPYHHPWIGDIDEVLIYNRVLSSNEVHGLFNYPSCYPSIAPQPASRTNDVNSTATFSVVASGTAPLSYQWRKNGTNLSDGENISGAASDTLTLADLWLSDAGAYTVIVGNLVGSTTSSNAVLTIRVPAGPFNGLFYEDAEIKHSSSGFFSFLLAGTRSFTGSISIDGSKYAMSGQFDSNSFSASIVVVRTNKPGNLGVDMQLSQLDGGVQVTGTVTDGNWTASLRGDRAFYLTGNVAPQAGNYTMTLIPDSNGNTAPSYGSYGIATVKTNGAIRLSGLLSDAATISQSTYISKAGQWPLYVPLYKGTGSLLGWITFTNVSNYKVTGNLSWIKTGIFGLYYTNGFTNPLTAYGGSRQP